ncbi:MAG: hypothetical protein KF763_12985 [Cyclobacteriaceae bacterium]|nr:hypothetical protein [Cyclobacteriaceae bacterium]
MEAIKVTQSFPDQEKQKSAKERVLETYSDEIIIGLCAPIGSLKSDVKKALIEVLGEYKYDIQYIRLSEMYIDKYYKNGVTSIDGKSPGYVNLFNKIKGGDFLRSESKSKSILVELAIQDITLERQEFFQKEVGKIPDATDILSRRKCYIIDSLKNKEELSLLRSIYKELFYCISIFSPKHERHENLRQQFDLTDNEIKDIMDIDEFEVNSKGFGQDVRNTFVDADFFMRVSNAKKDYETEIKEKVKRYFKIIFESEIVTPFNHEKAMYAAKSAAGNSACLSRQVGASIMSNDGTILSKGWNDVPRAGGNLYNEDDQNDDGRCFSLNGYCRNDANKDFLSNEIISQIENIPQLKEVFEKVGVKKQALDLIRNSSKIRDLIEFSRSVHAEMHAIIIGSQICGDKIVGCKLFTTTYPCHNCARHIILAGIKEVYYIEPYTKSLCLDLHSDAITEDESDKSNKVKILVYDGVAPRRYLEFFSKSRSRKKDDGSKSSYGKDTIGPKVRMSLQALKTLEEQAIHSLKNLEFLNP